MAKLGRGLTVEQTVEIAIQVNGRIRARIDLPHDINREDAIAKAKAEEVISKELQGKQIIKEIFVPGSLINLVVK